MAVRSPARDEAGGKVSASGSAVETGAALAATAGGSGLAGAARTASGSATSGTGGGTTGVSSVGSGAAAFASSPPVSLGRGSPNTSQMLLVSDEVAAGSGSIRGTGAGFGSSFTVSGT